MEVSYTIRLCLYDQMSIFFGTERVHWEQMGLMVQ